MRKRMNLIAAAFLAALLISCVGCRRTPIVEKAYTVSTAESSVCSSIEESTEERFVEESIEEIEIVSVPDNTPESEKPEDGCTYARGRVQGGHRFAVTRKTVASLITSFMFSGTNKEDVESHTNNETKQAETPPPKQDSTEQSKVDESPAPVKEESSVQEESSAVYESSSSEESSVAEDEAKEESFAVTEESHPEESVVNDSSTDESDESIEPTEENSEESNAPEADTNPSDESLVSEESREEESSQTDESRLTEESSVSDESSLPDETSEQAESSEPDESSRQEESTSTPVINDEAVLRELAVTAKSMMLDYTSPTQSDNDFFIRLSAHLSEKPESGELYQTVRSIITEHTGRPEEGDALNSQFKSIGITSANWKQQEDGTWEGSVVIYGDFQMSAEERSKVLSSLNIGAVGSDYEKAQTIYDWITSNCTYGYSMDGEGREIYSSAYGARFETATCNGIAQLTYDMCCYCGVPVRIVKSLDHAWNIVKVGGEWYIMDCTFGLGKSGRPYFLLGTDNYSEWANRRYEMGAWYDVSKTNFE